MKHNIQSSVSNSQFKLAVDTSSLTDSAASIYYESEESQFEQIQLWVTRAALLVFFLILNVCIFYGQKQYRSLYKSGAGVSLIASSNGHGGMLAPYVLINHGGSNVMLSPLVQMNSGELSGYKLAYSMNLSGNRHGFVYNGFSQRSAEPLQINWHCYFLQLNNALLGHSLVKTEQQIRREPPIDWKSVRFNTVEAGTGIELCINFSHFISWRSSIGLGVYHHLNYIKGMDHEQTRLSTQVGTGLQLTIH